MSDLIWTGNTNNITRRNTRCQKWCVMFSRFWLGSCRWLNGEHGFGRERAEMIYIASDDVRLGDQNASRLVFRTPRSCQDAFERACVAQHARCMKDPIDSTLTRALCGTVAEREGDNLDI
jgi:hypothetical protein